MHELVEAVVDLARQAARGILEIYETDFGVESKADHSPLTEADLASNRIITRGLARMNPAIPLLSEESAHLPFATRRTWPRYWLVDPLDGTREFVKRNGEFTVNIALVEGHRPALGVVLVPVSGVYYYAARDAGAFKVEAGGTARPIQVRALPLDCPTVVGSRSHANAQTRAFIERLGEVRIMAMGSSLKMCLVAEGSADIYPRFGPTSEWDTAAAQCIVEQAGGRLTDTKLAPLEYNTKESLLNPHFLAFGDTAHDWCRYLR